MSRNVHCVKIEGLEREPLKYCKGDGKKTFTAPFPMFGKVTFDERINVLEMYSKGDVSYILARP